MSKSKKAVKGFGRLPKKPTVRSEGSKIIIGDPSTRDVLPAFSVMQIPVVVEFSPADAEKALDSALRDCARAVMDAHEQIKGNRPEIDQLREETRALIAKMKAA